MKKINLSFTTLAIECDSSNWQFAFGNISKEDEIEEITLTLSSNKTDFLPHFKVRFSYDKNEEFSRWNPILHFTKNLIPNWGGLINSELAIGAPMLTLLSFSGTNCLTFSASDALNKIGILGGVCELDFTINCGFNFFENEKIQADSYSVKFRFDRRKIFYSKAITDCFDWFETQENLKAAFVPEDCFKPLYSSWASYHKDITEQIIEMECQSSKEYNLSGIIVDDGWQTSGDDYFYDYCGDWQPHPKRMPNIKAHINRVHQMGLKYLLWYSVPFLGINSAMLNQFKDKVLYLKSTCKTYILDPRFPEVRKFIISTYEKALLDWNIDGFKLDFIDSFPLPKGEIDPAIAQNYANRDFKSIPLAVDELLTQIKTRLTSIKPDIIIEFRQEYIGPAIRKYGNIFRCKDCPGDALANRVRSIDLRLSSGKSAVHSDMIRWNYQESTTNAALQLLAILFAVPQISVHFSQLNEQHKLMLKFWLNFMSEHSETLLHGRLTPFKPELNYPIVKAQSKNTIIYAIYSGNTFLDISNDSPNKDIFVINGSCDDTIILQNNNYPRKLELYDIMGVHYNTIELKSNSIQTLTKINFAPATLIKISNDKKPKEVK